MMVGWPQAIPCFGHCTYDFAISDWCYQGFVIICHYQPHIGSLDDDLIWQMCQKCFNFDLNLKAEKLTTEFMFRSFPKKTQIVFYSPLWCSFQRCTYKVTIRKDCPHLPGVSRGQSGSVWFSGFPASHAAGSGTEEFHSTLMGVFPDDLSSVFPWLNFFQGTQQAWLSWWLSMPFWCLYYVQEYWESEQS